MGSLMAEVVDKKAADTPITNMHTKTREINLHTRTNGFPIGKITTTNHLSLSREENKTTNLRSEV
jgi:hypothetical protein